MPKDPLESLFRQRFLRGSFGQELACRKFAGISTDKRACDDLMDRFLDGRPTGSDLMPVEDKLNLLDRCTG
jgi:hypothetical protein